MAPYNQLQVGRWNRFFQKLMSLKGPASIETIAPEVFPVHPIFHGAENRYLESWDMFAMGSALGAGGAGNFPQFRLRNPGGSNVIAVVVMVLYVPGATDNGAGLATGPATADLTTVPIIIGRNNLDQRARAFATLAFSNQNAAVSSLQQNAFVLGGSSGIPFSLISYEAQEIVILPGQAVQLTAGVANIAAGGSFMWRERFLEESERS